MPDADIKLRQDRLRQRMEINGIDACLITVMVNLYYITGMIFDGYFYLPLKGEPLCFLKRPASVDYKSYEIRKPEQIPELLAENGIVLPGQLMLEDDYLAVTEWTHLKNVFPSARAMPDMLRDARTVKTDAEVQYLKDSAVIHIELFKKIPALYRAGMTDFDFSVEIEHTARLMGHLGIMRIFGNGMEIHMGSVLAGDNALTMSPYDFAMGGSGVHSSLPIGLNGTKLKDGMTVMVDIIGNFNGYLTDMTRIYSFGEINPKTRELHEISIEIAEELAFKGKPGVICGDLYDAAMSIIDMHSTADYYMGTFQKTRFVGHGVGLEVNENPVIFKGSKMPLVENMTLALEPKFALKGTGPVGNENTYVVTKNGLEKITVYNEEIIRIA